VLILNGLGLRKGKKREKLPHFQTNRQGACAAVKTKKGGMKPPDKLNSHLYLTSMVSRKLRAVKTNLPLGGKKGE
jgi:hypothetical protein